MPQLIGALVGHDHTEQKRGQTDDGQGVVAADFDFMADGAQAPEPPMGQGTAGRVAEFADKVQEGLCLLAHGDRGLAHALQPAAGRWAGELRFLARQDFFHQGQGLWLPALQGRLCAGQPGA